MDSWIVDFESSGVIDFEKLSLHCGINHNLYIKTVENSKNYTKGYEVYCLACGRHAEIDEETYNEKKEFHCDNCACESWSADIE